MSVYRSVKARQQFTVDHDTLIKRLAVKLTVNQALKEAVKSNIDHSREAMDKAAVSIQRAWRRTRVTVDTLELIREQKQTKVVCCIQRATRKWLTHKKLPARSPTSLVDYSIAAFDYFNAKQPDPDVPQNFNSQVPEEHSLAHRLLTRSMELRLRLERPETISGAASKSLLPQARREIAESLRRRNFQAEGVTRLDNDLLRRIERLLAN